jgi:hypothetical protein
MALRESNVTAQNPFMNDTARAAADWTVLLEAFVAELTSAAYYVTLQHGEGTWLDLQLRLWHTLADTVEQWARKSSPGQVPRGSEGLPLGATSTSRPETPGLHQRLAAGSARTLSRKRRDSPNRKTTRDCNFYFGATE